MSGYKCPNCNVAIGEQEYFSHITNCQAGSPGRPNTSGTSQDLQASQSDGWNCRSCNQSFENRSALASHLTSSDHRSKTQTNPKQVSPSISTGNPPAVHSLITRDNPENTSRTENLQREEIRSIVREEIARLLQISLNHTIGSPPNGTR